MKQLFVVFLCLFLTGCGTAKKLTSSKQETGKYTETTTEAGKSSSSLLIDTTKVSGTEITYTKIEFYPPEPGQSVADRTKWEILDSISKASALKALEDLTRQKATKETDRPAEEVPNKHPPNVGAVKSIETLTIKNDTEERGITEAQSEAEVNRASEIASEATLDEATSEEPTADPYRWRYIFGILVLVIIIGTVGYFWLRKAGVFTKVASFFKKLF